MNERTPEARWQAIRDDILHEIGRGEGLFLLDLGCFDGPITSLADADGFNAMGVDRDAEAIGRATVANARARGRARFLVGDIASFPQNGAAVVLILSVWGYVQKQIGYGAADELMQRIAASSSLVYLEPHIDGDGPGGFADDAAVAAWLGRFGEAESIVSFPVHGRDAVRSIWRLKGGQLGTS